MWQSRVEIEHYSVMHFDHITVFEELQHGTVKGKAHTHTAYIDSQISNVFT